MRFVETPLQDAYLIELDPKKDSRGTFTRLFCTQKIKELACIDCDFVQMNLSENIQERTLRGLHFQAEPYLETKVIYCIEGALFDVVVDLRKSSPTYLKHLTVELSADVPMALIVPKGFAHGYLTLKNNTRLIYLMSDFYRANCERGFRYDDSAFGIQWPCIPQFISERDQNFQPFDRDG